MKVRRIVTGERSGRSCVVIRDEVQPIAHPWQPVAFYPVWGHDRLPPQLPTDVLPNLGPNRFPDPGAVRVTMYVFPASGTPPGDAPAEERDEFARRYEDTGRIWVDPVTNHHRTSTVDIVFVVSGEVVLILDEGAEVPLRAGDVLVQNGGMHSWVNRSREPCLVGFVLLGAQRA